jgi:hypothetical protein
VEYLWGFLKHRKNLAPAYYCDYVYLRPSWS